MGHKEFAAHKAVAMKSFPHNTVPDIERLLRQGCQYSADAMLVELSTILGSLAPARSLSRMLCYGGHTLWIP